MLDPTILCSHSSFPRPPLPRLRQAENGEWFVRRVSDRLLRMSRDGGARSRFLHAVATISSVYPAVLTRKLLLR